ncbi:hypothetical protein SSPIM334S_03868 [Streptomyces spiroverticillatus]
MLRRRADLATEVGPLLISKDNSPTKHPTPEGLASVT